MLIYPALDVSVISEEGLDMLHLTYHIDTRSGKSAALARGHLS